MSATVPPFPPPTPGPGPDDWVTDPSLPGGLQSDRLYVRSQLFQARIKANDVVQEHLKQIVTVASAALALTVTFLKDVLGSVADELQWSWLLPLSWLFLGASILLAVVSLALLVNNLDSAGDNPRRAFQAGGRPRVQVPVLATFLLFGGGMLLLGIFAASNFQQLVRFQKDEHAIASAAAAVALVTGGLAPGEQAGAVEKVELIPAIAGSAQSLPVWHIRLRLADPAVQSTRAVDTLPGNCANKKGARACRNLAVAPLAPAPLPSEPRRIDFFVDASKGVVTRVPVAR